MRYCTSEHFEDRESSAMPLFADKQVTSIGGLVAALQDLGMPASVRWFRGQADAAWKLVPSLGRKPNGPQAENALIKRFRQNATSLLSAQPVDEWHWLFLMQHHGVPTRLLDWTENPLVALFFVVADVERLTLDGCLWCLDPVGLDTFAQIQPTLQAELPFFGVDQELDSWKTSSISHSGGPSRTPVAALAPRHFPRLTAQSGVFTVTHREQIPVEDVNGCAYAGRFIVPAAAKESLRKDLSALGMTWLTLFPELDRVAAHATELVP
jgi:hypothetical protein